MHASCLKLAAIIVISGAVAMAQSAGKTPSPTVSGTTDAAKTPAKKPVDGHLTRVAAVTAAEEASAIFLGLKCDNPGNIYIPTGWEGGWAVHKLNSKGERVAVFDPTSNPELKVDFSASLAVEPDRGDLYQLVFPSVIDRYVYAYKSDGSFKSAIKLKPGFVFMPTRIVLFPSGQFLVAGSEYGSDSKTNPRPSWPFAGIFAADGTMLKELELGDEKEMHDMAASGDPRVIIRGQRGSNKAVGNTFIEIGGDGNAYLMRWTNPALFYAVSAGGEVERRFAVDPVDDGYRPDGMHIYKNRIAVWFEKRETHDKIMKIVDLEGREIATYDELKVNGKPKDYLGAAFACYSENPTRFTFLGSEDGEKLQLLIAEPQ